MRQKVSIIITLSFCLFLFKGHAQEKQKYLDVFFQAESQTLFDGFYHGKQSYYLFETGLAYPIFQDTFLRRNYDLAAVLAYKEFSNYYPLISRRYSAHYIDFGLCFSWNMVKKPRWSLDITDEFMFNVPFLITGEDTGSYRVRRNFSVIQNKLGLGALFNFNNTVSLGLNTKLAYSKLIDSGGYSDPFPGHPGQVQVVELWDWAVVLYIGSTIRIKF
ncbi:MAG: hypothetical protein JXR53_03535 [Bacteroidales bacterium]|nr:hypothetical protein [Bacteroidales bacterium]